MFLWTDERVALLKQYWLEGLRTEDIGEALGCGKNAAVGKAHRLELPRRRMANQPGHLIAARMRARMGALAEASASAIGVALLNLEPRMCRWPVGEHGEHLFCGCEQAEGRVYCAEHAALAYVKPTYKPRAPREPRARSRSLDWLEAA